MKIRRIGSRSDRGTSKISILQPRITWNTAEKCILIEKNDVADFSTDANHNYSILLSKSDVEGILKAMSSINCEIDFYELENYLDKSQRSLIRIQSISSGVYPEIKEIKKERFRLPKNLRKKKLK